VGAGHTYGIASAPAGTYGAITLPSSLGQAIAISGSNDGGWNYSTADSAKFYNLNNNFTVMAWIYVPPSGVPSSGGNADIIIGPDTTWSASGWQFGVRNGPGHANAIIYTTYGVADYYADNRIQAGVWQHIAVTKSSLGGIIFYTNGVPSLTNAATSAVNVAAKPYGVCRALTGTGTYVFNGGMLLDELRVYNTVLTQSEIQAAAAAGTVGPATTVAPNFNLPTGTYLGPQNVTLTSESGSTVFYSTDGVAPTTSSSNGGVGTASASVSLSAPATMTIIAYATNAAKADSPYVTNTYIAVLPASGIWTNPSGGDWLDTNNWAGNAVAGGSGNSADFSTLTLTTPATVTLGNAWTIGRMHFGDVGGTYDWTLNGSPLTLAGLSPTIAVSGGATIATALAGTNGMTVQGPGLLTLSAANAYTGTTVVTNGTLALAGETANNNVSRLGAGNIVLHNATLIENTPAVVFTNGIYWGTGVSSFFGQTNAIANFVFLNGPMSGPGSLDLYGLVSLGGTNNSFGGNVSISSAAGGAAGNGILLLAGRTLPATAALTVNDGATARINTTETVAGLFGSGTLIPSTFGSSGILVVNGTADSQFDGPMQDSNGRTLSLVKSGVASLTLGGDCTYTGATTISNGTLVVNGSLGSGTAVNVAGGRLSGIGTVSGATTVQPGGTLEPGTTNLNDGLTMTWLSLHGNALFHVSKNNGLSLRTRSPG
jgi:autotransporter-associated beta strand protein